MNKKLFILLVALAFGLSSCEKHEVLFDTPFVYITDNAGNNSSSATVGSRSKSEVILAVYMTSKTMDREVLVNYELEVGNGLKENEDFVLESPQTLIYPMGLFVNFIQIRWLAKTVDETKDNTVKVVLKECSEKNFTLGYPGPAKNNKVYTFTKVNI